MNVSVGRKNYLELFDRKYAGLFLLFISVYFLSLSLANYRLSLFIIISVIPLFLFIINDFKIIILILPLFFFLNYGVYYFYSSELFVPFIIISFLVTYRNIQPSDLDFPLKKYFLFYLFILLVSIIKSVSILKSLLLVNHIVLFLALIAIVFATVRERKLILSIIHVYLFGLTLNTLDVLIEVALTGKREFGFAGIMYVDLVSVGIVMTTLLFFFATVTYKKIMYASLSLLFVAGSIGTQTRNTWIATIVTLLIVSSFIIIKHKDIGFSTNTFKRKSFVLIGLLVVGISVGLVFSPNSLERVTKINSLPQSQISETGSVHSTLLTRVLIWYTAYNAFKANPILGIGAYSFPFTSQYYSTLNRVLYKYYVEDLPPHETFIAVAVETGIVGLVVFVLLYIQLAVYIYRCAMRYTTSTDKDIGYVLSASVLYAMISMGTTDAWLWGHCLILLGLLLGLLFAHSQHISKPAIA